MPAPNVLLVVLDAARRDALEPYGAPVGSTPALAALAKRGHALPLAYATSSWTLPSHASIFAGRLPRALGLGQAPGRTPEGAQAALDAIAGRLLPNVLREAGYATHGFSANLWASGHAGFDIGFDSFTYRPGGRDQRLDRLPGGRAGARLAWAAEGFRSRSDDGARELGRALRRSIAGAAADKPSFWFVNLVECHSPYLPPRPWNDLGPVSRIGAALDAERYLNFESIVLHAAGGGQIPAPALERMRYLYGRAVSYMDAWLADVLGALDGRGMLDETLVIVTADHGESFGEGGLIAHGFALSETLIHVPLVLAGPGAAGFDRAFSLARLPALIADAAGLRDHPFDEAPSPDGVAIAQYDAIGPAEHPRIVEFARRFGLDAHGIAQLSTDLSCATDGSLKLVRRAGFPDERYDLAADPGERRSLPDGPVFATLSSALDAAAAAGPVPAAPADQAGQAAQAAGARPAAPVTDAERAELERQMKLLGYM